jgi:hypothetical protein
MRACQRADFKTNGSKNMEHVGPPWLKAKTYSAFACNATVALLSTAVAY